MKLFRLCSRDGGQREDSGGGGGGGVHYDPTPGDARRKTATDPGGGVRLPGQWYCLTPGSRGGATPVAAP